MNIKIALECKPSTIFYSRDPHPPSKPPLGLSLIFYNGFNGYVCTDSADEDVLQKTGIPIKGTDRGDIPILLEDIDSLVKPEIGNVKVSPICFPG